MNIRLATASDDAQLRALARETVVPGHIRMIYAREPSFLGGVAGAGGSTQVMVAEDGGRIVGQGCRSIRNLYVDGKPVPVGYLSGLRLDAGARNSTVLARGYAFLRRLHDDGRTAAYLTTIVDGNERAREMLTSRRAGLPLYAPLGTVETCVTPVRSTPARCSSLREARNVAGTEVPLEKVVAFLREEGPRRQFFPVCGTGVDEMPARIGMENVCVAMQGERIAGVMGVWDQSHCRQCIVASYSRTFQLLRPCLNAFLRLRGCHGLPSAGEPLRLATAALVCVRHDDPGVFRALLDSALCKAAAGGLHQFALGLHERDPLHACMRRVFHVTYRSALYVVAWDGGAFHGSLDDSRVPYLELGAL